MSHEFVSGWFYQEPAWHRLGIVDSERRSPREAFRLAKADYSVEREAIYDIDNNEIPGFVRLVTDDGTFLTVRPESYEVIQNEELIKLAEALGDRIQMDAVVVLRDCKRISFTATIPNLHGDVVHGDEVRMRLVAMTGHDGTLAFKLIFSPIRVVCSNTLSQCLGEAAQADAEDRMRTITHKKNAAALINQLPQVMNLAQQRFTGGLEELKALARVEARAKDLDRLLSLTFEDELKRPINEVRGDDSTARPRRLSDLDCYESVHRYFDGAGIGLNTPGVRGTLYAAEQAVAQFYSHDFQGRAKAPARRDALRYEALQTGTAGDILDRTHRAALELTRA